MSCTSMQRYESRHNHCPDSYTIGDPIGYGDYGMTRVACCGENCRFISKFQSRSLQEQEENTDMDDNDPILKTVEGEIELQQTAAEHGLAPLIQEIHECTEGSMFIMERLDTTFKDEMETLSSSQLEYARKKARKVLDHYRDSFEHYLSQTKVQVQREKLQTYLNLIVSFYDRLNFTHARSIQRFKTDLVQALQRIYPRDTELWKLIPPDPETRLEKGYDTGFIQEWIPEDDVVQQMERVVHLCLVIRLIHRLHERTQILHGDCHSENLMKTHGDVWHEAADYQCIDFGFSRRVEMIPSPDPDMAMFYQTAPFRNYTHLSYLDSLFSKLQKKIHSTTSDQDIRNKKLILSWLVSSRRSMKSMKSKKKRRSSRLVYRSSPR